MKNNNINIKTAKKVKDTTITTIEGALNTILNKMIHKLWLVDLSTLLIMLRALRPFIRIKRRRGNPVEVVAPIIIGVVLNHRKEAHQEMVSTIFKKKN